MPAVWRLMVSEEGGILFIEPVFIGGRKAALIERLLSARQEEMYSCPQPLAPSPLHLPLLPIKQHGKTSEAIRSRMCEKKRQRSKKSCSNKMLRGYIFPSDRLVKKFLLDAGEFGTSKRCKARVWKATFMSHTRAPHLNFLSHVCARLLVTVTFRRTGLMWRHSFERDSAMCLLLLLLLLEPLKSISHMYATYYPDKRPRSCCCCLLRASCGKSCRADSTGFLFSGSDLGGFKGGGGAGRVVMMLSRCFNYRCSRHRFTAAQSKKLPPSCGTAPKRKCLEVMLSSRS